MAKDTKKKFKRSDAAEELLQTQLEAEDDSKTSDETILTPDQHRILGKAYRMILGWQPDGDPQLMPTIPDHSKRIAPPISNQIHSVEVGS